MTTHKGRHSFRINVNVSKKQQILDSALTLFSENGIDATSTASIAKAANVATGTLFHHYANKQTLVHQLYLAIKHDLSQQFTTVLDGQGDIKDKAAALWQNSLNWAIEHPEKLKFFQLVSLSSLLSSSVKADAMAQELGVIFELIGAGQAAGVFAKNPIDLVAYNCQGLFMSAGNFFIDNPQFIDDKEYRDASFAMFWNALCPTN